MSPSSTSGRLGGNRGPATTPGRSGGNRGSVAPPRPTATPSPQKGVATSVATLAHLTKVQPVKPVLEPAMAQFPPVVVLQALQSACNAKNWAQVRSLLLQNPTAFAAGFAGGMKCKLVLQGMTTEEVWAFCRCLPRGVALPTIWFERCRIHDKSSGQMPDDREPNALAYLASHTGLRGVCFRGGILGNQALTHLADGAEQRKQQGDTPASAGVTVRQVLTTMRFPICSLPLMPIRACPPWFSVSGSHRRRTHTGSDWSSVWASRSPLRTRWCITPPSPTFRAI